MGRPSIAIDVCIRELNTWRDELEEEKDELDEEADEDRINDLEIKIYDINEVTSNLEDL